MTDTDSTLGMGAFGPEPDHDKELGALLRTVVGDTPDVEVNWTALARRIVTAVAAPTPWWSYVARWERRAIPLALAAGIAGAFAIWNASSTAASLQVCANPEFMSAVLSGAPAPDASLSFLRSITGTVGLGFEAPQ